MMKGSLLAILICLPVLVAGSPARQKGPAEKPAAHSSSSTQEGKSKRADKVGSAEFDAFPEGVYRREFKDLEGGSFFFSDYAGSVVVINIWATWCGPCHVEIPHLIKVSDEYSARGVRFVGMTTESRETDAEQVVDFARELGMKYKVLWLDAESAKTLLAGNYSIPQTLVFSADGRLVTRFLGFSPSRSPELLRRSIEKALSTSPGR